MAALITLTTDLGLRDGYVAAMRGVILDINPEARLVDICHTISPRNVAEAAFVLSQACRFYPEGTIHVVVVDPGVGTGRRAVILKTGSQVFVAPDNGVLSYVALQSKDRPEPDQAQGLVRLGPGSAAVVISRDRFWRPEVSPTFHGRDIFAPVAAWLSRGVDPGEFGEAAGSVFVLPLTRPTKRGDGSIMGHVVHIDNFGNLITDISGTELETKKGPVRIGHYLISGLSRTYADGEGLVALIGSDGNLEIALRDGDAARLIGARIGDKVTAG